MARMDRLQREGQGPHQAPIPRGAGITNASASLPYAWAESSIQPVYALLLKIYEPVMEGGTTLRQP